MKNFVGRMRCFCILLFLALPLAANTSRSRIYVTNYGGTTVQVINPATNKIVQVIENVEVPMSAHFSPDGSRIYITNGGENVLDVLDRKTGKLIKKVPLSGNADDLAVTKDGKRVLVCINDIPGGVDIIDTTSLERVKTIPMESNVHDIEVTGDGKYAVVGSQEGKFAKVIDLQSEQVAWEVRFDKGIQCVAIGNNPDGSGRQLFLQPHDLNGFVVVDFATHKQVDRVEVPDELSKFKPPNYRSPSHGLAVAPDGKTVWVASTVANSVFAYSLPQIKPLGVVAMPELKDPGQATFLGANPHWITFTPDSKTAYVSNSAIKSVSAIDVKTIKEVAVIQVGETPRRISTLALP
jgi:YVTN family beta-propeller protein